MKLMKIFYIVFIIILSCTTSGVIKGSRFIDNTYDFEVKFPNEYRLTAHGAQAKKRVHAMKWKGDRTIAIKPLYVISVINTPAKLSEVVAKQKDVHFEPRYYLSCEIEDEESESINGRIGYIVFYDGVGLKAATAFIKFKDYVMKIEYIVDGDFYNKDEFVNILENIIAPTP